MAREDLRRKLEHLGTLGLAVTPEGKCGYVNSTKTTSPAQDAIFIEYTISGQFPKAKIKGWRSLKGMGEDLHWSDLEWQESNHTPDWWVETANKTDETLNRMFADMRVEALPDGNVRVVSESTGASFVPEMLPEGTEYQAPGSPDGTAWTQPHPKEGEAWTRALAIENMCYCVYGPRLWYDVEYPWPSNVDDARAVIDSAVAATGLEDADQYLKGFLNDGTTINGVHAVRTFCKSSLAMRQQNGTFKGDTTPVREDIDVSAAQSKEDSMDFSF